MMKVKKAMIRNQKQLAFFDNDDEVKPNSPVFLISHAFIGDKSVWSKQIEFLTQEGFRVIVPDLWGYGASDKLPEEDKQTSIDQLAEDHWALMQKLEIKRFSLMGASIGGMILIKLAIDHPDAITGLCVMSTTTSAEPSWKQWTYAVMLQTVSTVGFTDIIVNKLKNLYFADETLKNNPELVKQFIDAVKKINFNYIPDIVGIGRALFYRRSYNDELTIIASNAIPVTVLLGKDDKVRIVDDVKNMATRLACNEVIFIENAGHSCMIENPDEVNQALRRFIVKHHLKSISLSAEHPSPLFKLEEQNNNTMTKVEASSEQMNTHLN